MQDVPASPGCQSDLMDPARANALRVLLELAPDIEAGSPLPPFFHQIYFWDVQPAAALGRDGHPRVGGLIPDMGLPRRMWAGGRLRFHAPLLAGYPAEKRSICEAAERKEGRSGRLALVTLRHEIHQQGKHCVTEWQDLVYREEAGQVTKAPAAPLAPHDHETSSPVSFDPTMLFRYSALTFNGHRIHYDAPYARDVEGYAGLVVHGPLLAQLLVLKAEQELGALLEFSFRATAPLMHFEKAMLCRDANTLWVCGPEGRLCMRAEVKAVSE